LNITWVKVSFADEKEEFLRTVNEFSDSKQKTENFKLLESKYKIAKIVSLNNRDWSKMQNTDSWETDTLDKIQKAVKSTPRSIESVINEFFSSKVRSPIALKLGDGSLYLIAGNTRLMVAKMLEVKPKIVIIETDW
jgi:hypothetical protein